MMTTRAWRQLAAIAVLVALLVGVSLWQQQRAEAAKKAAASAKAPAAASAVVQSSSAAVNGASGAAPGPQATSSAAQTTAPGSPEDLPGATIPPSSSASAAPEVDATLPGVGALPVSVIGNVDAGTAQDVARAGAAYVVAYWRVDSSRPYPGKDVDWITAQAVDGLATDIGYQAQSWRSPRDSDKAAYDAAAARHYTVAVTVRQLWVREPASGPLVTVGVDVMTSEDGTQRTVRSRVAQMRLVQRDGGWKVASFNDSPTRP